MMNKSKEPIPKRFRETPLQRKILALKANSNIHLLPQCIPNRRQTSANPQNKKSNLKTKSVKSFKNPFFTLKLIMSLRNKFHCWVLGSRKKKIFLFLILFHNHSVSSWGINKLRREGKLSTMRLWWFRNTSEGTFRESTLKRPGT